MDFINTNQLIGIALFFVGSGIMTWCNRYEAKIDRQLRDPRMRYAVIDGGKDNIKKKKTLVGTLLSILGIGCAIGGIVLFFLNV